MATDDEKKIHMTKDTSRSGYQNACGKRCLWCIVFANVIKTSQLKRAYKNQYLNEMSYGKVHQSQC